MEQLSMPYRIALVGMLVVGVLYLLVLKPSDEEVVPAAAPPVASAAATPAPAATTAESGGNGITSAVGKAQGAAATQAGADAATAKAAAAASEEPATAAAPTTAATAAEPATAAASTDAAEAAAATRADGDPSAAILAELDRGHTPVVLFTDADAADDIAVRRALRRIDTRGGKVDVHVVSIKRVGAYEAITRGVQVSQAPTLLVIGRQKTARTIVGFTTTAEIDQLVGDVRRR